MAETNEARLELRILKHLLKPSYLSAMIAVLTTLIAMGSEVISKLYLSNGWLADTLRTVSKSDQQLFSGGTGNGSSPFNAVLLFLFWAIVGLTVYFFVIGVVQVIQQMRELGQEMNFVHTNRNAIFRNFAERLIARWAGLVLVFVTAAIYLKLALPFALTVVQVMTLSVQGVISVILAIAMLLITMHLLAVLLRIVALRPRLFTAEIEA